MVLVLELVEVVAALALLYFIVTQVFIPIVRGTPLYPMFRREKKILDDLKQARQAAVEDGLEKEVKKTRERV
jgi:hypothetical protein